MIKQTVVLLYLLLLVLISTVSASAIESTVIKFYKTGTLGWTEPGEGEPKTVPPYSGWTCQAVTNGITALTLRVTGNIEGIDFPTSDPILEKTCDENDLSSNDICNFSFTSQPVLRMRVDVVSMTGTSVDKVICLGIGRSR